MALIGLVGASRAHPTAGQNEALEPICINVLEVKANGNSWWMSDLDHRLETVWMAKQWLEVAPGRREKGESLRENASAAFTGHSVLLEIVTPGEDA